MPRTPSRRVAGPRPGAAAIGTTVFLLFLALIETFGWGADGHRFINRAAVRFLPPAMARLIADSTFLSQHGPDADRRRDAQDTSLTTEATRHYIDIDDYPDVRAFPHDHGAAVALYGWTRVKDNGVLPWATVWTYDSLVARLRRNDWNAALQAAADLGHYVADAFQPLHTTKNYDGQNTGNGGIHSRYESTMLNAQHYLSALAVSPDSVRYIADPTAYMFDIVLHSLGLVDTLLHADTRAKQASGWNGSGGVPDTYYAALWSFTRSVTLDQMQRAAQALANLWYSAWIDAGLLVPSAVRRPNTAPADFGLVSLYPNPARDVVTVQYTLPREAPVAVSICTIDGRRELTLDQGMRSSGIHTEMLDTRTLRPGVYFIHLRCGDGSIVQTLLIAGQ